MFKKVIIVVALACAVSGMAFAQDAAIDPHMDKGTLAVNAGLAFGWGIGLGGGAEFVLARVDLAEILPLTFGAAGRAYFSSAWGYSFFDVAAMGTGHVGLKGLDLPPEMKPWTDRLDYYVGLGIGVSLAGTDYWTDRSPINFASMTGVNYFLNDNLAINFESGYMGYWGYGLVGVLLKF